MRKKIVAGNWKMNLSLSEARELFENLKSTQNQPEDVLLYLYPSSIYLNEFVQAGTDQFHIGAQNFYPKENGAYTGEVSIAQLKGIGVQSVLIGHSERRAYFGEHDDFLKAKVDSALEFGMHIMFCCGEPLKIREEGTQNTFVKAQIEAALFHLSDEQIKEVTIAYEPVWAIGTGLTATTEQAEAMHAEIRTWLTEKYGIEIANEISILYGGSCNASNAKELFACPNVDGGLIGGAALKAESFLEIANSY